MLGLNEADLVRIRQAFEKDSLKEAIQALESGVRLLGRTPYGLGWLGFGYARAGQIDEAKKLLTELQDLAQKEYVIPSSFSLIYLGLGEIDQAIDWQEKAVDEFDLAIFHYLGTAAFDSLRSHPRYETLLRKMNL